MSLLVTLAHRLGSRVAVARGAVVSALTIIAALAMPVTPASSAPTVNWVTWTSPGSFPSSGSQGSSYTYATTAVGSLTLPDGSTVYTKIEGEVVNTSSASGFGVSGNTYWSNIAYSGNTGGSKTGGDAFKSVNVPNLPPNGDRIGLVGGTGGNPTQVLSFYSDSGRTTPATVSNIVMNILSLGSAVTNGKWDFTQNFDVLSDNAGKAGFTTGFLKSLVSGRTRLSANEGIGTIQFTGTFTSIEWEVVNPEFYAAWNIGVTSETPPSETSSTIAESTTTAEPTTTTAPVSTTTAPTTTIGQSATTTVVAPTTTTGFGNVTASGSMPLPVSSGPSLVSSGSSFARNSVILAALAIELGLLCLHLGYRRKALRTSSAVTR